MARDYRLRSVMQMATMSILRLVAASMSDAESLLLFQPASPSRVLLLMESQSSLASRDELVWRAPHWLEDSPGGEVEWGVGVARPGPPAAAERVTAAVFLRPPPLWF